LHPHDREPVRFWASEEKLLIIFLLLLPQDIVVSSITATFPADFYIFLSFSHFFPFFDLTRAVIQSINYNIDRKD
jgi:hypothetical protein